MIFALVADEFEKWAKLPSAATGSGRRRQLPCSIITLQTPKGLDDGRAVPTTANLRGNIRSAVVCGLLQAHRGYGSVLGSSSSCSSSCAGSSCNCCFKPCHSD